MKRYAPKRIGRPKIGERMAFVLPVALVSRIDDFAANNFTTRSDAIRTLIELGLDADGTDND